MWAWGFVTGAKFSKTSHGQMGYGAVAARDTARDDVQLVADTAAVVTCTTCCSAESAGDYGTAVVTPAVEIVAGNSVRAVAGTAGDVSAAGAATAPNSAGHVSAAAAAGAEEDCSSLSHCHPSAPAAG